MEMVEKFCPQDIANGIWQSSTQSKRQEHLAKALFADFDTNGSRPPALYDSRTDTKNILLNKTNKGQSNETHDI